MVVNIMETQKLAKKLRLENVNQNLQKKQQRDVQWLTVVRHIFALTHVSLSMCEDKGLVEHKHVAILKKCLQIPKAIINNGGEIASVKCHS